MCWRVPGRVPPRACETRYPHPHGRTGRNCRSLSPSRYYLSGEPYLDYPCPVRHNPWSGTLCTGILCPGINSCSCDSFSQYWLELSLLGNFQWYEWHDLRGEMIRNSGVKFPPGRWLSCWVGNVPKLPWCWTVRRDEFLQTRILRGSPARASIKFPELYFLYSIGKDTIKKQVIFYLLCGDRCITGLIAQ